MKELSTRTNMLLLFAFAMIAAMYVALTNYFFTLSCIFLGASIGFSFLTVFSHVPEGQRRGKLILLSACSLVSIMLFLLVYS